MSPAQPNLPYLTKTNILHKMPFHIVLIIITGVIAYSNTFRVPFYFDDYQYIIDSPFTKNLEYFTEPSKALSLTDSLARYTFKTRTVGFLTFAINYKLHGFDVAGYHITNLSIHIINVLLVYWLVLLTFKTPFFNLHPSSLNLHPSPSRLTPYTLRFLYLTPFLLTLLIIPLSLIGIDKPADSLIGDITEAARAKTNISRWDYLFTEFTVVVTYLRLLFLPVNQNLDHYYPVYNSFLNPNVYLSFLILLAIFGLAVYLFYYSKKSSSFNLHPSTFLTPYASCLTLLTLAALVIALSIASYQRNSLWQDKTAFWGDVVKKSPKKIRGYNELGLAYMENGKLPEAVSCFQRALTIDAYSEYSLDIYLNLANALDELGYTDDAIITYKKIIALNYGFETAHYNLGMLYYKKNMFEEAAEEFKTALSLNPLNS
ncbi:MAG: tetratricopeptide repeat protein [Nitrospirae bacterium]|nr:tetratricopeptide repeat protein [Nitrospirota bacterium]